MIGRSLMHSFAALHWAVKGGYARAVQYLCSNGANVEIKNKDGKRPIDMVLTPEISIIFGLTEKSENESIDPIPVQSLSLQGTKPRAHWYSSELHPPNLEWQTSLKGPSPLSMESTIPDSHFPLRNNNYNDIPLSPVPVALNSGDYGRGWGELCLRAKIEDAEFWIEFPLRERSFSALQLALTQQLGIVDPQSIQHIIKAPNVLVRNDWDVSRLQIEQELTVRLAK